MYRYLVICLTLLLSTFSGKGIEASVGHSLFYLPDPIFSGRVNPYIEWYWQLNPSSLHYSTNEEKNILGKILVEVKITNDTGKVLKEDEYIYQTIPVAKADYIAYLNILELKRYFVLPGKMHIQMHLTDLNDTNNRFALIDSFLVPATPKQTFISDISLIDTFFESDARSPFRKNGVQFIPLCQPFLDEHKGTLSYFSEIYFPDKVQPSDYPIFRTIGISKKEFVNDRVGLTVTDTLLDSLQPYVYGRMPIDILGSGNYYLNISVNNRNNEIIARKSIFFQRLNTHPAMPPTQAPAAAPVAPKTTADSGKQEQINVVNLEKTFLKQYSTAQVKAILKMLLPVADPDGAKAIQNFIKRPDELYMRYFIYNYFHALDKEKPERPWKAYSERVKEVNKKFSCTGRLGYETERGFMYLRYGAPSEVITVNNDRGALPYEIWQYNQLTDRAGKPLSNAVMLFYKRNLTDMDYILLHTNISGEVHNQTWRSFLYQPGTNNDQSQLRAEFYIGNR